MFSKGVLSLDKKMRISYNVFNKKDARLEKRADFLLRILLFMMETKKEELLQGSFFEDSFNRKSKSFILYYFKSLLCPERAVVLELEPIGSERF